MAPGHSRITIDQALQQIHGSFSDLMEERLRALGSRLVLQDLDAEVIDAALLTAREAYERERPNVLPRSRAAMERVLTPDGRLREDVDPRATPQ